MQSIVRRDQATLNQVQTQWDEASSQKHHVQKIRHKMTPVSRFVRGKEIHFQLKQNQIAYVPINELIAQMRPQVMRQKSWLTKYRQHQGEIGPFKGFRMAYVIEREKLSVIDELRTGQGMVRIAVTGWKVIPERSSIRDSHRSFEARLTVLTVVVYYARRCNTYDVGLS